MKKIYMLMVSFLFFYVTVYGDDPRDIAKRIKQSTVVITGFCVEKDLFRDDKFSWSGSGVIIDERENQYVIATNLHVLGFWTISGSDITTPDIRKYDLTVKMFDGRMGKIDKIVINSLLKDIALLYISASVGDYPVLEPLDEYPGQGEKLFAMGHPMGSEFSFTSGITSSVVAMESELGAKYNFIQTDTPVNSGNSGGPLVNEDAELVGINANKLSKVGVEGMGFAVSSVELVKMIEKNEFIDFPENVKKLGSFVRSMQGRR